MSSLPDTVTGLLVQASHEDLASDEFANAIIVCLTNRERAAFNLKRAKPAALKLGTCVVAWREPFRGTAADPFYSSRLNNMSAFPDTFGYFVPGSPSMILYNIVSP